MQDEEALLCRIAVSHDLEEGLQLFNTPGWATLLAILEDSGERPPKRPLSSALTAGLGHLEDDQLAKRFKGARLK